MEPSEKLRTHLKSNSPKAIAAKKRQADLKARLLLQALEWSVSRHDIGKVFGYTSDAAVHQAVFKARQRLGVKGDDRRKTAA